MGTRTGVGYSENPDTGQAVDEALGGALGRAGLTTCDLVLLFATARHDETRLLRAVRARVGPEAMIIGGGASGAITNDSLGYEGCQIGVAVMASDSVRARTFVQPGLAEGELAVGRGLGAQIRAAALGDAPLLVMYESVKKMTPDGPALNMGTPFLEGMTESLGTWPPVIGLGFLGDVRWKPGRQFFGDRLETQSALALSLTGPVKMSTVVINNLRPMSTYHEVTSAEGPVVLGIGGRPALEVIEELIGPDLRWEDYPLTVTFGVNSGDKFGEFREEAYANYLCVAVDRQRRGLIMSDTYLTPGTQVQLMRRDINHADIRRRADALVESVRDRRPFLALYIDCAGRAGAYIGSDREEATEIQRAIGPDLPLLGVYSGSEIAKIGGGVRRLNHAGVLAIYSE